jgi:hypothetical protein
MLEKLEKHSAPERGALSDIANATEGSSPPSLDESALQH